MSKRVTVSIPYEIHEKARIEAFKRRVTLKEAAEEAFRLWLVSKQKKDSAQ